MVLPKSEGKTMMWSRKARSACAIVILLAGVSLALAQSNSPLRLERTIPLPGVKGRIDHLAFDADKQRLFVAALGNNTVEIIDIKSGRRLRTIGGLAEPQGVLYEPEKKRLWIANGSDGTVRIFDALTFQPLHSIELGDDADNIRRDAATQRILVGYGSGGIAVFDPEGNKVADINLDAHPESFQLEKNGPRMFVNLPRSQKVAVIDRTKSAVVASWASGEAQSNFPMALDEEDRRLFIVCRKPAVLLVLDNGSGAVLAKLPTVGDSDDVFYDQKRKRIYVSGGEGAIAVYQQKDADHYGKIAQLETLKGARTSLFVPELSRLFLAVRQEGENTAAIRVYEVLD
jgi:DNA-binding beta-propeller fold protein YncE